MKPQDFLDVSNAANRDAFVQGIAKFAESLEFDRYSALFVVDKPGRPADVYVVDNAPEAFHAASRNPENVNRDPINAQLKRLVVPVLYDQSTYVSAGAGDMWEGQAPFGYRTGIALALHLPNHKHFLLGVDRHAPLPKDESRLVQILGELQLLAAHAQSAAERLLLPLGQAQSDQARLTPREAEVLRWTIEGKTAWEIGRILGLSEHTVNRHLFNASKRMDAANKIQAAMKALMQGLI